MANNTYTGRVQQKRAVEADWLTRTDFVPLAGEVIVYQPDNVYDYVRVKVGDGTTTVVNLPFVADGSIDLHNVSPIAHEDIRAEIASVLPAVTTDNNGAFLRVVDGVWAVDVLNGGNTTAY